MTRVAAALLVALVAASPLAAQEAEEEPDPLTVTPEIAGERSPEELLEELGEDGEEPEDLGAPLQSMTFDLPIPEEEGGGRLSGFAGSVDFVSEREVRLTGGAEVNYKGARVQAQSILVEMEGGRVRRIEAEGVVILDEGPKRISGATMSYDFAAGTVTLTDAEAYVDPDFFFTGDKIVREGPDRYVVHGGYFTSCSARNPQWSFRASKVKVRLEGFARATNVRFEVKKAPLLYLPYIAYPAKTERTSGLLFPNLGYSSRRGEHLGLAWFQTFGDSYDSTLFLDLYGDEYHGVGNEFRYKPSERTGGYFEGYAIDDPVEDEVRWKVRWKHTSDRLPLGFRGVVDYRDFSDFEFFRDFERNFNDVTLRQIYGSAFVSKSTGPHSFNLLADNRETFAGSGRIVTLRQLPELEYRLRPTRLGPTPIFLEVLSSVHNLDVERNANLRSRYERADLFPEITIPLRTWPWLSMSFTGGARYTWYGDSVTESGNTFTGESLSRFIPTAGADFVGPSFSRIFERGLGTFGKFKHIIEPRWTYRYVDEFDDIDLVPLFDEVDRVRPLHVGGMTLVNRLLAKPADQLLGGETREILELEISQFYSLDDQRPLEISRDRTLSSNRGPLSARLRYLPSDRTSLDVQAVYSNLFDDLASASLSSNFRLGANAFGLTWFTRFDPEIGETRSNQVRFNGSLSLFARRLSVDALLNYDFQTDTLQQQRYVFNYNADCYGVRFEIRDLELLNRSETDYRFSVSLKNIGDFIDLTGGSGTDQGV